MLARAGSATPPRRPGAPPSGPPTALVLARERGEPQSAGQARRALMRLSPGDQVMGTLQGECHFRARMLHIDCFYEGNCEPEHEMAGLIRGTISYIQTAEELST